MKVIILTFLFLISFTLNCFCQWFDYQVIQSTVLLEKIINNKFINHGTGFLMFDYKSKKKIIVVTCAHLLKNKKTISVRVNPDSTIIKQLKINKKKAGVYKNAMILGNSLRFIIQLKDNFVIDSMCDIAVFKFDMPYLNKKTKNGNVEVNLADILFIPKSLLCYKEELSIGNEVYFVGFPLGFGSSEYLEPIIRSGSIAWLPKDLNFYLLDAFSYNGNSGSPIFKKRILGTKPGDLSWSDTKLVGMVVGHSGIKLKNVLKQPNPDSLKFETTDIDLNIGLAKCVYTDDIMSVISKLNNKD